MKQEIRALTALRGIAALAVALQHFSAAAQEATTQWIPSLAPHGYMAVDFFFVLSGFIMAYTYADGFAALGARAWPDFFARRFARIWPVQAATVLVLVLIAWLLPWLSEHPIWLSRPASGWDIAVNLAMLQGFGIGHNLNGPSATVSLEFAAYALFPVLLAIALNRRTPVAVLGFAVAAAAICWQAALEPRLGLASRGVANLIVRCLTEFTLGLGAYRLYRAPGLLWLGADWLAAALSGACVVSLLLRLDLPAALMFPLLVAAFGRNRGWPARIVASRRPYFLGVVSYSLYLVHNPLRFAEFAVLRHFHPGPIEPEAALACAALGAVSAIPIAWMAYRWIERPGRDLLRGLMSRRAGE